MNRNFLNLEDLSKEELEKIIENAISLKSSRKSNDLLVGKYIALIFEKSSTVQEFPLRWQ